MAAKKLLVEGNDDQDFFKAYCEKSGLNSIDVFPPKTLDTSSGDGWGNLINNLPILLNQIKAGDIDNLGIIIDADYPPDNNGGFQNRYTHITNKLQDFGYNIPKKPNYQHGDIFTHSDGLPSIGLWVMPNHKNDGMFENFIASMICDDEQTKLLNHANDSINNLPRILFNKELHLIKAQVFTWRAWQKRPGLPLNKALNDGILSREKTAAFEAWLKSTFK